MTTILVPLDGSPHSDFVLTLVRSVVRSGTDADHLHLLRVVPPFEAQAAELREGAADPDAHLSLRTDAAARHVERLMTELAAEGFDVSSSVVLGEPVETILSTAQRIEASIIALSTHGRAGPRRWIQGSTAESVLRAANIPLLLLNPERAGTREPDLALFGSFLVAFDGSTRAAAILPHVAKLARDLKAKVTLLRCLETTAPIVVGVPPMPVLPPLSRHLVEKAETQARRELEVQRDALIRGGVSAKLRVERGTPAELILSVAEDEDVDLIAMTTRGQSGLERLLFGSTAESVVRRSARPVLVLRPPGAEERPVSGEAKDRTAHEHGHFSGEAEILYPI